MKPAFAPCLLACCLLACCLLACGLATSTAQAAEFVLVRWIGPQRCEVMMNRRPLFGRWEEVAVFPTRKEADRALAEQQRLRYCRQPEPKPTAAPGEDHSTLRRPAIKR